MSWGSRRSQNCYLNWVGPIEGFLSSVLWLFAPFPSFQVRLQATRPEHQRREISLIKRRECSSAESFRTNSTLLLDGTFVSLWHVGHPLIGKRFVLNAIIQGETQIPHVRQTNLRERGTAPRKENREREGGWESGSAIYSSQRRSMCANGSPRLAIPMGFLTGRRARCENKGSLIVKITRPRNLGPARA